MAQRIKGQEATVTWTGPGGIEDGFTAIQNFEAEFQLEILREDYIGETTQRRDEIFNGVRIRMEFHLETPKYLAFIQRVKDRAQRRVQAGTFDATVTLIFPNGETARALFENLFFGTMPLRFGGRQEYVSGAVEAECEDGRFLGLAA